MHKINIRAIIDYAIVSWPNNTSISISEFCSLYNEFQIGAKEPELIILSHTDYEEYWNNIGASHGARVAVSKTVGTKTYTGSKFMNAIVLSSSKLEKGEIGVILRKDKDVPTQILE